MKKQPLSINIIREERNHKWVYTFEVESTEEVLRSPWQEIFFSKTAALKAARECIKRFGLKKAKEVSYYNDSSSNQATYY